MATWKIAAAKQRLSEVLREAQTEPQKILNRERLVAAVVDAESFRAFEAWRRSENRPLAEAFAELRRISAHEKYRLTPPTRKNRKNPLRHVLGRRAG